jgi:hypothetical protein
MFICSLCCSGAAVNPEESAVSVQLRLNPLSLICRMSVAQEFLELAAVPVFP